MYGKANFVLVMDNPENVDDNGIWFFTSELEAHDFVLSYFEESIDMSVVNIPPEVDDDDEPHPLYNLEHWLREYANDCDMLRCELRKIPDWVDNHQGTTVDHV